MFIMTPRGYYASPNLLLCLFPVTNLLLISKFANGKPLLNVLSLLIYFLFCLEYKHLNLSEQGMVVSLILIIQSVPICRIHTT